MAPLVDNPQIKAATLHNPLPFYLHTYIWPFGILWAAFFRFYLSTSLYDRYISEQTFTFIWSGSIFTFQAVTWLATFWATNVRTLFTTVKAPSVKDADLITVFPVENAGSAEICKIIRETVRYTPPLDVVDQD